MFSVVCSQMHFLSILGIFEEYFKKIFGIFLAVYHQKNSVYFKYFLEVFRLFYQYFLNTQKIFMNYSKYNPRIFPYKKFLEISEKSQNIAKKKYWKYFRNYFKIWKIVYRNKYQNFVEIFQVWKKIFWYFSGILWEYTRNILFQKNFNKILPRYQHYSWNIFWSFGIMLK